jgi:hypothetical protein
MTRRATPRQCDIGGCKRQVVGALLECADGVRRALCPVHRLARVRKLNDAPKPKAAAKPRATNGTPYDDLVGTQAGDWTVIRVLRSREHRKYVYLECRCVCGTIGTPYARDLVAGKTRRCAKCAVKKSVGRPPAAHRPTTMRYGAEVITVCSVCLMQPDFAGWANPCGVPVVNRRVDIAA